jgi:DNA-binding NtrC family response regulator
MTRRSVVAIDPRGNVSDQLRAQVGSDVGFHFVESVADAKILLAKQACTVGLVVFDAPVLLNQEAVESLITYSTRTEWIAIVSAQSLESPSFQGFMLDAFHDYHTLPLDPQRLLLSIGHACGKATMRHSLNGNDGGSSGRFSIIGRSPLMQDFFLRLDKVIKVDIPVLIGGETGTGKELVAQAIHQYSDRSDRPFVVVNCAAIPEHLIQSELFGHERGAFTGAVTRKIGSIEAANGGDLFLDEIGDLPLSQQANLLRVIQERSITRVGSHQSHPIDFRIIAATHVDLSAAVRAGSFREDLYYRLSVLQLDLPPLRQREGDVDLLADAIFKKCSNGQRGSKATGFSAQARHAMNKYHWPGNVRELMNRVRRAVILSETKLIGATDLGLEAYAEKNESVTLETARATVDRAIVEKSLRTNANNVSKAARQLGVSRVTFYRMMQKHNLEAAR